MEAGVSRKNTPRLHLTTSRGLLTTSSELMNQPIWIFSRANTSDAPTELLHKAYNAFNQNRVLLTVFSDFSKTFDTFGHEKTFVSELNVWSGFTLFKQ